MQKATLIEAAIVVVSGALTAGIDSRLADHNVSVGTIIPITLFILLAGLQTAQAVGQAFRTSLFACPAKGCTVSIRARDTSPEELARLQALATDHTKHGSTR